MRSSIRYVLFLVMGLASIAAFAAEGDPAYEQFRSKTERTDFAKSIEDLPIMPGLEVVEDKDLLILFGEKRIAQAVLSGPVDIDSVYYFYGSVLPELGWKKINSKTYERGNERLVMKPSSANDKGVTFVRFAIEPVK